MTPRQSTMPPRANTTDVVTEILKTPSLFILSDCKIYSMDNNNSHRGDTATKQAAKGRDARGRFTRGNAPSVGFHTHPERRSNGPWKRENTPRAKLEKLLSDVTLGEFFEQINEHNVASNFDEKIGDVLISERLANLFTIEASRKIKVNSKEFDRLMHFVYGTKTENETSIIEEDGSHTIKSFVIPTLPEGFIEQDIKKQLGASVASKVLDQAP